MKRTIAVLALTAGLAMSCSPALAMGEDCVTFTEHESVLITPAQPAIPAVPPVYETVTEYEFTHAQDGNGHGNGAGPENKWVTDPNWNAEGNPNSVGWVATGNTREVTTDVILTPGVDAVPAVDAVYEDREIPVTICKPVLEPTDPPLTPEEPAVETPPATEPEVIMEDDPRWDCATMGNKICGPVAAVVPSDPGTPAPPAETAVRTADAVPLASVGQPEELAYTGASDWVLPAGLGLLLAGGGLMVARRRLA